MLDVDQLKREQPAIYAMMIEDGATDEEIAAEAIVIRDVIIGVDENDVVTSIIPMPSDERQDG